MADEPLRGMIAFEERILASEVAFASTASKATVFYTNVI